MKNCYICRSTKKIIRKGTIRDAPKNNIYQCSDCGLVYLNIKKKNLTKFYTESGMHGENSKKLDEWLKETNWDDKRRFEMLKNELANKKILDFGCGAGGFLYHSRDLAASITGIELERRVIKFWDGKINIKSNIETSGKDFDIITAFHVVEHLSDPRKTIKKLSNLLSPKGKIIIEVPNGDDALLTLFDCNAFQNFTYWSQHLFLFNPNTLRLLSEQAGLKIVALKQYQRYPLSNHLYWLSKQKPGGHHQWSFLNSISLDSAYRNALASIGGCDTLIAYLEKH